MFDGDTWRVGTRPAKTAGNFISSRHLTFFLCWLPAIEIAFSSTVEQQILVTEAEGL
jgi:hypothetical protein